MLGGKNVATTPKWYGPRHVGLDVLLVLVPPTLVQHMSFAITTPLAITLARDPTKDSFDVL